MAIASLTKAPRLSVVLALDQIGVLAPQHQFADGIGEAAAGDAQPVIDGLLRPFRVGRQQDLERRALRDLRVELPARAEAEHRLMAGLRLERGRDLLRGLGEIRRDGDVGLPRDRLAADLQMVARRPMSGGQHLRRLHGTPPGSIDGDDDVGGVEQRAGRLARREIQRGGAVRGDAGRQRFAAADVEDDLGIDG